VDRRKGRSAPRAWTNDGASADLSALRRAEIEARRRTPSAKLHVRLADLLTTTEVTRDLPIMVWLDHPADAWEARVREIVGAQDDPRGPTTSTTRAKQPCRSSSRTRAPR
jgi:hypothetical protein